MAQRTIRIAVSIVLMAGLLAVFFWNVDLKEVGRALKSADPMLLVAAAAVALFAYWLRVLRWQQILRPIAKVRHSSALLATVVGYAGITLLPARMGDLLRPILLSRREPVPISASLASILTERIFDLWAVVAYFMVFLLWPPPMPNLTAEASANLRILNVTGWIIGAGLLAGTAFLLALFRYQERFVTLITGPIERFRPTWREPLVSFLNHFLDGLRVLQRPRDLAATALTSSLLWLVIFMQVHTTLAAFSINLPFRAAFLLVILTVIGMAVPTPGGVGGFHAMLQLGLTGFFGVDYNLATGIAIAYHALCFFPITIIGLICIPAFGLSLKTTPPEASDS